MINQFANKYVLSLTRHTFPVFFYCFKAVVLLSFSLIAGCTTVSYFIVGNYTDEDLKVSYGPAEGFVDLEGNPFDECFEDGMGSSSAPSVTATWQLGVPGTAWRKLEKNEYTCDFEEYSVSFLLKPSSAAQLSSVTGYRENAKYFKRDGPRFRFLILEGKQGTLTYKETEVTEAFHMGKESSSQYILRYE